MILRDGTEDLLIGLHDELKAQVLDFWNSITDAKFTHCVPWMNLLPERQDVVPVNHPALLAEYTSGRLLVNPVDLGHIDDYMRSHYQPFFEEFHFSCPVEFKILLDVQKGFPGRQSLYDEAVGLLRSGHPLLATLFSSLIDVTVPLDAPEGKITMAVSSDLARGAVFISLPSNVSPWTLGMDLAHELAHQALMIINSADPLIESNAKALVYSGVRQTFRPAPQALHAAAALGYMILYCTSVPDRRSAEVLAESRQALSETLADIEQKCTFTVVGSAVYDDLKALCLPA